MNPGSDQLSIETPELVAIEMPLAGIGSRFIALLVDTLIWFAGTFILFLLFWTIEPAVRTFSQLSYQWVVAIITLAIFLLNWGYFTLFEALCNGRTPGKRVAKIRVIQQSGRPIGFFESMARNLVRFIDQIPFFYAVGVIAMFATRQHQRLGDLAAGTLVVRDRDQEPAAWTESPTRTFTAQIFSGAPMDRSSSMGWLTPPPIDSTSPTGWPVAPAPLPEPHMLVSLPAAEVARLTAADLEVLESFLARRLDISLSTREALAVRIAAAIQAKSGLEPPPDASVETFLEAVARDLRDLGRLR